MSLSKFGTKKASTKAQVAAAKPVSAAPAGPKKDERVPITVRLDKTQWRRVKELALDEGSSVQELAVRGLSRLLEEKGLDPL